MQDTKAAIKFLRELGREDLANLLKFSKWQTAEFESLFGAVQGIEILSPPVFSEALSGLSGVDRRRIAEAVTASTSLSPAADRLVFSSYDDVEVSAADAL